MDFFKTVLMKLDKNLMSKLWFKISFENILFLHMFLDQGDHDGSVQPEY